MRLRLTDGTHQVEITAGKYTRRKLDDVEACALRILDALRDTPPPVDGTPPFGFTPPANLDGTALGSDTERAEPYVEPGRDLDEYDERHRP